MLEKSALRRYFCIAFIAVLFNRKMLVNKLNLVHVMSFLMLHDEIKS